jgi:hypothetical protein
MGKTRLRAIAAGKEIHTIIIVDIAVRLAEKQQ